MTYAPKGHAEHTYKWRTKDDRVTPAELRAITISLNDERGTGGQSKQRPDRWLEDARILA
jgi:hypothetical protein